MDMDILISKPKPLKVLIYLLIPLFCSIFFAISISANSLHGLSLYGPKNLKYKIDQPYEYSNPDAIKGGHLVLADFGAFTKLNPASLKGVRCTGDR